MKVRVRMYRQGLGDCFLLTFETTDGARHVLIDCGTLGATTTGVKMDAVVADIRAATDDHLHLLIATHEHKDHVSGFLTAQDDFDLITVDRVWMAWTEDAADPLAQQLEKHHDDLIIAAKLAAVALEKSDAPLAAERKSHASLGAGIRQLLAFVDEDALGADFAKTVHAAMTYAMGKGEQPVQFLRPGPPALEPEWLPGVRVYVLGPPRDPAAIAQLGDHGDPELYSLVAARAADLATSAAFFAAGQRLEDYHAGLGPDQRQQLARLLPFDLRHRLDAADEAAAQRNARYFAPGDEWRRIDYDWLTGAADLALQLDGQTNNTSLALAFELIDSGKVLLFPADAQVGNWVSWHGEEMQWTVTDPAGTGATGGDGVPREVTARDLLRRTVLYKVGHHASHNATIREQGLELMESPELVALIPVDRAVALNKHPVWQMPARELYRRLIEKTNGRVLRSDIGWAAADEADFVDLFPDGGRWAEWEAAQQAVEVVIGERVIELG